VVWLSKFGTVLHSADLPDAANVRDSQVVAITTNVLIVRPGSSDVGGVLRSYRLKKHAVAESDLVLDSNDFLLNDAGFDTIEDATGFLVFGQTPRQITVVKRYTKR
jgi:hypothetical protein